MSAATSVPGIEIWMMMPKNIPDVLQIDDETYAHQSDNWTEPALRNLIFPKVKTPGVQRRNCVVVKVDDHHNVLEVLAYFMILIEKDRILILDVAVKKSFRHTKKIEILIIKWIMGEYQGSSKSLAILLALSRKDESLWFYSRGITVVTAKIKGHNDLDPVFMPMTVQDASRVQQFDENYFKSCGMTQRDIEGMISRSTHYGVVGYHEGDVGQLVAYAIYKVGTHHLELEGDFPLVVCGHCQRRYVGTNLMDHLSGIAQQKGMTLRVSGMNFCYATQYEFLAANRFPSADLVTQGWVVQKPREIIQDP